MEWIILAVLIVGLWVMICMLHTVLFRQLPEAEQIRRMTETDQERRERFGR